MAEPTTGEIRSALSWWIRLCQWLWIGLLWLWGTLIVGVGINIGSTWLISPTMNIAYTPVGWLLSHLLITIPIGVGLLVFTMITGIVATIHRRASLRHSSSVLEQQNRERFLLKLQHRYDDVLEQSLQGAVQIALGFRRTPDAIINTTRLRFHQTDQPEQDLPAGTSIFQVYDRASGELLILGEPGAGKTTQLLNLAMDLRGRAMQDERHPLPVIVNLSTWANSRRPLQEWIIDEVAMSYDVPRRPITKLVMAEQLLPLLDGLDEVPLSARSACIEAINTFRQEYLVPVVVCSRSAEYFGQPGRLLLQGAVVVQPLSEVQVDTYFREVGSPLAAVRSILRKNAELRKLVRTPLMLHVWTLAYQDVSVRELPKRGSLEEQQQQVLDQYVRRMLSQPNLPSPFSNEQIRHTIAWLAQQMKQHNQTVFYLEQLQPDWLPTGRLSKIFDVLALRIPGFIMGALLSLSVYLVFFNNLGGIVDQIYTGLFGGLAGAFISSGLYSYSFQLLSMRRAWKNQWRQYVLMSGGSGVLLGGVFGVLYGIWGDPTYDLIGLIGGLIQGTGAGLSILLLSILISAGKVAAPQTESLSEKKDSRWWHRLAITNIVKFGVLVGLSYGLGIGLSVVANGVLSGVVNGELSREPTGALGNTLSSALSNALLYGLPFCYFGLLLGFLLLGRKNTIVPAERIVWSLRGLGRSLIQKRHLRNTFLVFLLSSLLIGFSYGLSTGVANGLSYGLIVGLSYGLSYGLSNGLSTALGVGILFWLLLGLWNGVSHEALDQKQRIVPNEGMHRSAHNSLIIGLIAGFFCGLFGYLNSALYFGPSTALYADQSNKISVGLSIGLYISWSAGLVSGLVMGIAGALLAGLLTGGWACIQHLLLRVLLKRANFMPWQAVQFFDHTARRILLIKEGGGYRFVHRLFLDYFAALEVPTLNSSEHGPRTVQVEISSTDSEAGVPVHVNPLSSE